MSALMRLKQEVAEMKKNPSEMYSASPDDETNLFNWTATVCGPVFS